MANITTSKLTIDDGVVTWASAVIGTEAAGTSSDPTYKGILRIVDKASSAVQGEGLEFKSSTYQSGYGWMISNPDVGSGNIPLVFGYRNNSATWTEAMRLDGRNGILSVANATPETDWHSGFQAIHLGNQTAFANYTNRGGYWLNNLRFNGSSQFTYIRTDEAAVVDLVDGHFRVRMSASGAADANASPQAKFYIENNGQTVIGSSTVKGNAKLSNYGTMWIDPATFSLPVTDHGSDSTADVAIAIQDYGGLYYYSNGYIRNIIKSYSANGIMIGQDGTAIWNTIDIIPGNAGKVRIYSDDPGGSNAALTMTIDDNMVGIGTTSPSQKLEVSGEGANAFIRVAYDDNYWLQLGPQTIQMERANGSTGDLTISTTSAGTYGSGGGEIVMSPAGDFRSTALNNNFYSGQGSGSFRVGRNASEHFELYVSDGHGYMDYEQDSDSNGSHTWYFRNNAAGTGQNDIQFQTAGAVRFRITDDGGILRDNASALVNNDEYYPLGHYTAGDEVFSFDPTWTQEEMRAFMGDSGSNFTWVEDSTAPGGWCIEVSGYTNVGGNYDSGFPYIPVMNADDLFYMECWIKNTTDDPSVTRQYMGSQDFDHAYDSLGGNPGSWGYWVTAAGSTSYTFLTDTTWTLLRGYIGGFGNSTGQFETGTKYWTPLALFSYPSGHSGTQTTRISGWRAWRVRNYGHRYFDQGISTNTAGGAGTEYDTKLGSDNSTHMLFVDASTDRVGVKTDAPAYELHVNGQLGVEGLGNSGNTHLGRNDHAYISYPSNGNIYFRDYNGSAYTNHFTMDSSGNFTATGNVTAYSDARLKENIKTIDSALEKVNKMRGVTYDRIDEDHHGVGVLAQELESIAPELVQEGEEYKSVAYGNLTAYLVEAIKELNKKIDSIQQQLEE